MDREKCDRLSKDLAYIISVVSSKVSQGELRSIILYGSYGRGEGAFYHDFNNQLQPYNDYDLLLVFEDKKSINILNEIEGLLRSGLSVKWIDISQKTTRQLKALKPSIFNYDLKYGSKVIYGDETVLELIPNFQSSQLPLIEVEVLFFTRLWCFCGCLKRNWRSETISSEDFRFFRNQMAKAILAVGDALLLSKNGYHTSYVHRVEKLVTMNEDNPDLVTLFKWAIDEKLKPKSTTMTKIEIENLYSQVAELFYDKMLSVISLKYRTKIESVTQYFGAMQFSFENLILAMKILIKTGKFQKTYFRSVDWAQAYILESFLFDDKPSIDKVRNMLRESYTNKVEKIPSDWDELRLKVAELKIGGTW